MSTTIKYKFIKPPVLKENNTSSVAVIGVDVVISLSWERGLDDSPDVGVAGVGELTGGV